jgi:hypothetical protein
MSFAQASTLGSVLSNLDLVLLVSMSHPRPIVELNTRSLTNSLAYQSIDPPLAIDKLLGVDILNFSRVLSFINGFHFIHH